MKNAFVLMISMILSFGLYAQNKTVIDKPLYPKTRMADQVDDYFGTKVSDPFRWLEDDNSEETKAWVQEQNQVTNKYLSAIPYRDSIKERLTSVWNFPKQTVPFRNNNKIFFFTNSGLQNQNVLYVNDVDRENPELLLDPNLLSADGTVSLSEISVSNDGKFLAYKISRSGSDWNEIYVMDIKKKKVLKDHIEWVKFSSIAWSGKGFYYSCYSAPVKGTELSGKNEYHKVYYHKIGDKQSKDVLVYENTKFPLRNFSAQVTDDERFLLISETESTSGNALYVKDLLNPETGFVTLVDGFESDAEPIGNIGTKMFVRTNIKHPKYQIMSFDLSSPGKASWETFISDEANVIESAVISNKLLVVKYLVNAMNQLVVFDLNGIAVTDIELPGPGTVGAINSRTEDDFFYYSFTSFTSPAQVFKFEFSKNISRTIFTPKTGFNFDEYTTEQVFYESFDGTKVPMFIVHKKGIQMNGNNPTLLYGYGGFNISLTPSFSVSRMVFLENGGIYAIANIRGGGEFGEEWHKAGTKEKKQTVFNDFIAAAEYLINKSYTKADKLAISGGSNGGLLVGACMTQRPDLFKVALPAVGVLDMLRYHKFTIGWAWATDYGTSEEESGFKYLYKYSPLHVIKKGVRYPATLVTTADHDDRVVPAHSFKFISTLQENQGGTNPVLIRIATKAGHGSGKPTSKIIEEAADVWAFTFYHLGINPVFPKDPNKPVPPVKVRRPEIKDPYLKQNLPKPAPAPQTPGSTPPPKGSQR